MTAQGVRTFISADDIHARVEALGRQIRGDHPDGVHLVGVLKGAFMFMSDLARAIDGNTTLDFIAVSSYGSSTKSSGQVQLLKDLDSTPRESRRRHRRGHRGHRSDTDLPAGDPRARSPRNLRTACLLSKPSRRKVDVKVDYVGFTIEDKFVVGYGLDYAEQYRNLPHIGVIGD